MTIFHKAKLNAMKKTLFILFLIISSTSFGQTVTAKPIYEGSQRLTVRELLNQGNIYFGYQNPDYTTIVDIVSFVVDSKDDAITLMKEAVRVLEMEKTAKDQHIRHTASGVGMVRYGFNQKIIYIEDLMLSKKMALKIIEALENYTYQGKRNVSEQE